MFQKNCN